MIRSRPKQTLTLERKLLTVIANEILTPLEYLAGHLEKFKYLMPKRPDVEKSVLNLMNQVNSSRSVIKSILSWSNLYVSANKIIAQSVLLKLQVDLILLTTRYIAPAKSFVISNKIPELPQIKIKLPVFEFALMNLTANSIRRCPQYGHIDISCKTRKDMITIAIWDDGPCIPPDELKDIFTSKKILNPGTGASDEARIALMLCYDLLSIYESKLWVNSNPGRGTTFYFSMPSYQ